MSDEVLHARVPNSVRESVEEIAEEEDISLSATANQLLQEALEQRAAGATSSAYALVTQAVFGAVVALVLVGVGVTAAGAYVPGAGALLVSFGYLAFATAALGLVAIVGANLAVAKMRAEIDGVAYSTQLRQQLGIGGPNGEAEEVADV